MTRSDLILLNISLAAATAAGLTQFLSIVLTH